MNMSLLIRPIFVPSSLPHPPGSPRARLRTPSCGGWRVRRRCGYMFICLGERSKPKRTHLWHETHPRLLSPSAARSARGKQRGPQYTELPLGTGGRAPAPPGVGGRAGFPAGCVGVFVRGAGRTRGDAGAGGTFGFSLGREDVRERCAVGTPRHFEVGEGERLSMGRSDLHLSGGWRTPRHFEVGPRKFMSLWK